VKDSYPNCITSAVSLRGKFFSHDLPNEQVLDWDGLRGRLRSSSFAPTEAMRTTLDDAELERIFQTHRGTPRANGILDAFILDHSEQTGTDHEGGLQLA